MPDTPSAPIFSAPVMPEPAGPTTSVWSRLVNVVAAPAEAFEGIVALEKKAMLWLMPMLIAIVVTAGFAAIVMNNPAMKQMMRQKMAEQFDQQVRDGKMSQADAEKMVDTMGGITGVMGIVGGAIAVPLMYVLMALVFFMIISFVLGGEVSFINIFVVVALASIVGVVETVVTGLMQYATADMYLTPSLGALVAAKESPVVHAALSRLNPFSFWWLYVVCVGFASVSNLAVRKVAMGVGGAWLIWSAGAVALSGLSFFQQWQK